MQELLDTIGKRITYLRKKRGMTQKELAEKVGIHQAFISSFEHDRRRIYDQIIIKIAEVLEVTPNDILGFSEIEQKDLKNLTLMSFAEEITNLKPENQKALFEIIRGYLNGAK